MLVNGIKDGKDDDFSYQQAVLAVLRLEPALEVPLRIHAYT